MKPYFQSGDVTIYCGRSESIIDSAPADTIVTDPPYGIKHPCNFNSRGRSKLAECNDYPDVFGDDKPFDPSPLLKFERVVIWGANYFSDELPPSSGWLVWDKERPDGLDQSTCELAWTNCVSGVRRFRHLWHGMMRASERQENYHPTQKPVALMVWVLNLKWLSGSHIVLDPYMGAGPVGVACAKMGRKFIGVEANEAYCEIAAKRIQKELDSPTIMGNTSNWNAPTEMSLM